MYPKEAEYRFHEAAILLLYVSKKYHKKVEYRFNEAAILFYYIKKVS
jgi:hypothetical protein